MIKAPLITLLLVTLTCVKLAMAFGLFNPLTLTGSLIWGAASAMAVLRHQRKNASDLD